MPLGKRSTLLLVRKKQIDVPIAVFAPLLTAHAFASRPTVIRMGRPMAMERLVPVEIVVSSLQAPLCLVVQVGFNARAMECARKEPGGAAVPLDGLPVTALSGRVRQVCLGSPIPQPIMWLITRTQHAVQWDCVILPLAIVFAGTTSLGLLVNTWVAVEV